MSRPGLYVDEFVKKIIVKKVAAMFLASAVLRGNHRPSESRLTLMQF